MASLVLTAATLGGTTAITPTDQAGAITLTLPSTTGTLALAGGASSSISNGTSNVTVNSSGGTVSITTAGTTALTVTTAQNVGVGTTSPSYKLVAIDGTNSKQQIVFSDNATYFGSISHNSGTGQNEYRTEASGAHGWFIGTSSTTANMALDSSGNLLLGTTVANYSLNIKGSGSSGNSSVYAQFTTTDTGTTSTDGLLVGVGVGSSPTAYILQFENAPIAFSTNGTERMRLNASGGLLINTTSASSGNTAAKFVVKGGSGTDISEFQVATNGVYAVDFRNSAGNQAGYITVNSGTVTYNSVSDYRLKNTIAPMTGALAKVIQLKPCTYKWNEDNSESEGFIAHELAEVCPHAVTGTKDAVDENGNPKYQGIDTSFLVATLTSAIQELSALVTAQSATITSLTERITALEGK
jgi:hypothetical protein